MAPLWSHAKVNGKGDALIASTDIPMGVVLLTEEACVVGPSTSTTCVECLKTDAGSFCDKCNQSMCPSCKDMTIKDRHDMLECNVLRKIAITFVEMPSNVQTLYNLVFPLRFALLKSNSPELYQSLLTLEAHLSQREAKGGPQYESLKAMSCLLLNAFKHVIRGVSWTAKELQKIIGIQFTNSFEINSVNRDGRAMYYRISKINHSCVPNTSHSNDFDEVEPIGEEKLCSEDVPNSRKVFLRLSAQRTIQQGEEITIRYTSVYEVIDCRKHFSVGMT